ncbi:ATP-binding protein [Staphylococcus aureus]|uniref:ATP-binding protein n=1 Tax=Staphylococcus aureus TaxID=1280 RepID=UPI00132E8B2B|nr:hypothetical protein D7B62_12440 [Staphylococcus aureus]
MFYRSRSVAVNTPACHAEKKSTIFTTNINFNLWNEIFDDPKIANAILDRILHHSSVVKITGKSYRLKDHSPKKEIT